MQISELHGWNLTEQNARSVQKNLRAWISTEDKFTSIRTIARIKVKSLKDEPVVKASVTIRGYPDLKLIESQSAAVEPEFPATKGLSSFRLAPAVIEALKLIKRKPDLIICDGKGIINDQEFGLASHIGLLTQIPTIGISKPSKDQPLVQSIEDIRGSWMPMPIDNKIAGAYVRVVEGVAPVEAAPGNGISVDSTVKYVLDCFPKELSKKNKSPVPININEAKRKA